MGLRSEVGDMLDALPHLPRGREGPQFNSTIWPGPFSVALACSPRFVFSGYSPNAGSEIRLTGDSKVCLSLCVSPV